MVLARRGYRAYTGSVLYHEDDETELPIPDDEGVVEDGDVADGSEESNEGDSESV